MKIKMGIKIIIFMIILIGLSISAVSYASDEVFGNSYKIIEGESETENYIVGIYQGTRVKEVKDNLKTGLKVYSRDGKELSDSSVVHTGAYLKTGYVLDDEDMETEEYIKYIIIVCGDLKGSGKPSLSGLVAMKNAIIGKEILKGAYNIAADINLDGKISATDLLYLKKLIIRILQERDIYEKMKVGEYYKYGENILTNSITIKNIEEGNSPGIIEIPETIGDKLVTAIESVGESSNAIKITIPYTVTKIDSGAFMGMAYLREIEVDENNQNYSSENGVLFNKSETEIIAYPIRKDWCRIYNS